jgi:hypothetical protein
VSDERSTCSERIVLRGTPDVRSEVEVGFTLQSTVGVFAPRAIAVEIEMTHFLTTCCSRRRREAGSA